MRIYFLALTAGLFLTNMVIIRLVNARQIYDNNSPLESTQPNRLLSPQQSPQDLYIVKELKKTISSDLKLKEKSKKINIFTQNKSIILKGFVESQSDYALILNHVKKIAPEYRVLNEMSIRQ